MTGVIDCWLTGQVNRLTGYLVVGWLSDSRCVWVLVFLLFVYVVVDGCVFGCVFVRLWVVGCWLFFCIDKPGNSFLSTVFVFVCIIDFHHGFSVFLCRLVCLACLSGVASHLIVSFYLHD